MFIGYARVSTRDQRLELQIDALRKAGCEHIYQDKQTGRDTERPGLLSAIANMQPGDTLVVWKLSRLSRSLKQLIDTVQLLEEKGIHFKSLNESIDTKTATGKLLFHVFAAVAQFESDNDRENTLAGLAAARARGRIGGRPRVMNEARIALARKLLAERPDLSKRQICRTLLVSKATLYRYL
jgi:DNA invertase Pin-like site-specific DNA recombinase